MIERPGDDIEDGAFDLPSVLARLDTDEPAEQRAAVETVRAALTDHPDACLPTVPKLRALLEQPTLECHETVAYCLAELATESPVDVAPSVDEIVAFVDDRPDHAATGELLRCLAIVATERPSSVAEHAATIADALERRGGDVRWGLRLFQAVATDAPAAIVPAVPVLTDALAADPERHGTTVLSTLGRVARSEPDLPTLEFADETVALLDHADASLRRDATGCLADVAVHAPAAVEPARSALAAALEDDDPETRANAAVAIARLAAGSESSVETAREPLLALLGDDHERVRANACVALGHGSIEAAADRLAELARRDPDPDVRERADWALDRLS